MNPPKSKTRPQKQNDPPEATGSHLNGIQAKKVSIRGTEGCQRKGDLSNV